MGDLVDEFARMGRTGCRFYLHLHDYIQEQLAVTKNGNDELDIQVGMALGVAGQQQKKDFLCTCSCGWLVGWLLHAFIWMVGWLVG